MRRSMLRRLLADRSGSILLLVGLSLLFLVGIAGAGYDLGHQQLVRQKLQQASDAAALAGASMILGTTAADRQTEALRYFTLNYPASYLGVPRPTPSITIGANDVTVTASATFNTNFVVNLGISNLTSSGLSDTQFKKGYNKIDAILVMDNSNSMRLTDVGASSYINSNTGLAMTECQGEFSKPAQITYYDTQYGAGTAAAYKAACTNPGYTVSLWGMTGPSRVDALRYAANIMTSKLLNPNVANNQVATVRWDNILVNYSDFSTSYSVVYKELSKMFAGGATDSTQGLKKAQSLGAAGFRSGAIHVVILLTDGSNNTIPTNNDTSLTICNALKDGGTLVYTIGLGSDLSDPAQPWIQPFLSDCATGPNGPGPAYPNLGTYFFVAPDAASLNAAFTSITGSLQALRIVE